MMNHRAIVVVVALGVIAGCAPSLVSEQIAGDRTLRVERVQDYFDPMVMRIENDDGTVSEVEPFPLIGPLLLVTAADGRPLTEAELKLAREAAEAACVEAGDRPENWTDRRGPGQGGWRDRDGGHFLFGPCANDAAYDAFD